MVISFAIVYFFFTVLCTIYNAHLYITVIANNNIVLTASEKQTDVKYPCYICIPTNLMKNIVSTVSLLKDHREYQLTRY